MPQPPIQVRIGSQRFCLAELCRRRGLNYDTVRKRIKYLGWEPEEALELRPRKPKTVHPRRMRDNKVTYQGISATISAHCRRLGLPRSRTYARYAYGLPLDEVFAPDKR